MARKRPARIPAPATRAAPRLTGCTAAPPPSDAPGRENPLRDYWYPVALSAELTDKPISAQLLDEPIVLWRADGAAVAFQDLCIHRGTRLSLGWIEQSQLVCGYHGWSYNREGACTRIPSLPPERGIPARARVARYRCMEKYGLVFICPGQPRRPVVEFPEFDQPGYRTFFFGRHRWKTSAARMIENFMDISHFPWVHPGILGDRARPLIPSIDVIRGDGELSFEVQSEGRDRTDAAQVTLDRVTYRIILPFTIYNERITPRGDRLIFFFLAVPVSSREMDRYLFLSRNYALDEPDEKFRQFSLAVAEQDRAVVESQRPEALPLDLSEELHLRGPDNCAVVYRRMLRELGVADVA
jgi:phenylpropionate dioxygenase-like ring-hydroxylating dioxygenase large terminal subunit